MMLEPPIKTHCGSLGPAIWS